MTLLDMMRQRSLRRLGIEPRPVLEASPRHWQVIALQEGWNRNQAFYSVEVLRRSLPLFEGLPVIAHADRLEEMTHDEAVYNRTIPRGRNARVVGRLRNPHLATGSSLTPGPARVVCDLEVTNQAFLPLLEGAWKRIAFSIDGEGEDVPDWIDGRFGRRILRLIKLQELTMVSCPAGWTRLYPAC